MFFFFTVTDMIAQSGHKILHVFEKPSTTELWKSLGMLGLFRHSFWDRKYWQYFGSG